ncbi:AIPR family protein [Patescibacteria group bacterium]|nr:AIPR family protein [Patescibacteria group bacterium]
MPHIIKHNLLKKTLDEIAETAPDHLTIYHPDESDQDGQIHKYSRTQIHLFLRVHFGLLDFNIAEDQITDGTDDGGLDAYHIDAEKKTIYLIQSKYKTTPEGYLNNDVDWREFFKMELDRIVQGETASSSGHQYNGKIRGLQQKIGEIADIARWNYTLIYLGNVPSAITKERLLTVSGGVCTNTEILHGNDFYNQVLIPYLKRDFYDKEDFSFEIYINQERSANRIRYSVDLADGESAEVQLCFVPTMEIARMMSQYRNSILQYNPRCYVGIKNTGVNADIRDSVSNTAHNEFSLLNNGITVVCNEVNYNDNTAQRGRASITVSNPQIVNGGQTAFTLAHLFENNSDNSIFDGKEVLTKFIIIVGNRDEMIEKISNATNNQNPIRPRDKASNDLKMIQLQSGLFDQYGVLLERKQGEFYDSIKEGLIDKKNVIDSVILMRLLLVYRGSVARARSAGEGVLFRDYNLDGVEVSEIYKLIRIYNKISNLDQPSERDGRKRYQINIWGNGLRYGQWAIIYAVYQLSKSGENLNDCLNRVQSRWIDFETTVANHEHNQSYSSDGFDYANYYKGSTIDRDLNEYIPNIGELVESKTDVEIPKI